MESTATMSGDLLWIDQSGERWCPGAGPAVFGKRYDMVLAGWNGSLQRYLDIRLTGTHDGAAVTGNRADAAVTVVASDSMVNRMSMAKSLHGQQQSQQQDFQAS